MDFRMLKETVFAFKILEFVLRNEVVVHVVLLTIPRLARCVRHAKMDLVWVDRLDVVVQCRLACTRRTTDHKWLYVLDTLWQILQNFALNCNFFTARRATHK